MSIITIIRDKDRKPESSHLHFEAEAKAETVSQVGNNTILGALTLPPRLHVSWSQEPDPGIERRYPEVHKGSFPAGPKAHLPAASRERDKRESGGRG